MKAYSIHPMINDAKSLLRYSHFDGSYDQKLGESDKISV